MSKRGADIDLNQDNYVDLIESDEQGSDVFGGFKKANENVLKTRIIKAPRSRMRSETNQKSTSSSTTDKPSIGSLFQLNAKPISESSGISTTTDSAESNKEAPQKTSLFKGFSFGAPSNSTTSVSTNNDSTVNKKPLNFNFGKLPQAPVPENNAEKEASSKNMNQSLFSFSSNNTNPPSEKTTKPVVPQVSLPLPQKPSLFSEYPSSLGTQQQKPAPEKETQNSGASLFGFNTNNNQKVENNKERLKEYLKNIRGLNVSFNKTINEMVESDPFEDLSGLFDQYLIFVKKLKSQYSDVYEPTSKESSKSDDKVENINTLSSSTNSIKKTETPFFMTSKPETNKPTTNLFDSAKNDVPASNKPMSASLFTTQMPKESLSTTTNSYGNIPLPTTATLNSRMSIFGTPKAQNSSDSTNIFNLVNKKDMSNNNNKKLQRNNKGTDSKETNTESENENHSDDSGNENNDNSSETEETKPVEIPKFNFGNLTGAGVSGNKPSTLFGGSSAGTNLFSGTNSNFSNTVASGQSNVQNLFGTSNNKSSNPPTSTGFSFGSKPSSDNTELSAIKGNEEKLADVNKSKVTESIPTGNFFQNPVKSDNNESEKQESMAKFVIGEKTVTSAIVSPFGQNKSKDTATKKFSFGLGLPNTQPTVGGGSAVSTTLFGGSGSTGAPSSLFGGSKGSTLFGGSQPPANPFAPKTEGFGFGSGSFGNNSSGLGGSAGSGANEAEEEVVPASPNKLLDMAGKKSEGEENEQTVYETRAKIFKYNKEQKKYVDLGVGYLKLNKSEKGKTMARLLCRQEGLSKVTMNSGLFKNMPVVHKEGSKDLVVVVPDESKLPVQYMIRVKTPAISTDLYNHIITVRDSLN
ncbi:hypothetical protein BB559_002061 [Furculomyces boomerangus]|uniref:RanBD1 domain-containing protein n=1 Tax=Furculomyces boomerangus TaxID=61424 RepID=A0A2T9YYD5_9FUNG|nr:hypothetical protein BB559_002061 [Furculomyces boomerangus]